MADPIERLLGQVVVLASQNLAERADGFFARKELTGDDGERFADEEGLREER